MFIYIFEGGEVQTSDMGPTVDDMISIQEGELAVLVVKFDNLVYEIMSDGTDRLLRPCLTYMDKDDGRSYHVPTRKVRM